MLILRQRKEWFKKNLICQEKSKNPTIRLNASFRSKALAPTFLWSLLPLPMTPIPLLLKASCMLPHITFYAPWCCSEPPCRWYLSCLAWHSWFPPLSTQIALFFPFWTHFFHSLCTRLFLSGAIRSHLFCFGSHFPPLPLYGIAYFIFLSID